MVTGTCFLKFGTKVVCVDSNREKIAALRSKTLSMCEPGLEEPVVRNMEAGRLFSTTDLAGATVRAHDPKGMRQARTLLNDVAWCDNPYHTIEGAAALVLLTEWNEYCDLKLGRVRQTLRESVVVDMRNIYLQEVMAVAGFNHTAIGRGTEPLETMGLAQPRSSAGGGS